MMMMMNTSQVFGKLYSFIATILFAKAVYEQYVPFQWRDWIRSFLRRYTEKVVRFFSPYLEITFEEYTGDYFDRNEMYTRIETYLSEMTSMKARGLKASFVKDGKAIQLGLADYEEVTDVYEGIKLWWTSYMTSTKSQTITFYPGNDEKRYFLLKFHGRHRKIITEKYLNYIVEQGKLIAIKKRQRKLYTNNSENSHKAWSYVDFQHPATFDTLAMEETKKHAIVNDLIRFSKAKNYYLKIGKPWKRGYLLYGPPGTGKSTMIVAMSNLLDYDIYDLELTTVKNNTHLRRLLIDTTSKSIIVIEDIDCSLDLTGQRVEANKEKDAGDGGKDEARDKIEKKVKEGEEKKKKSEVTLSGLLNFIDGIWSGCGDERIIIFTTNHIDKLDPALIRRGRMDMHIELSYCNFEAFKVLARNYLDVEEHPLFETIRVLLEETNMTPADVGENLMPKSLELDVDVCLNNLVLALEKSKEDDKLTKAEEEATLKETEEATVKEVDERQCCAEGREE